MDHPWAQPLLDAVRRAEEAWKTQPRVTLACAGYSDAHWQVFHPDDTMPSLVVDMDGNTDEHPDGRDV